MTDDPSAGPPAASDDPFQSYRGVTPDRFQREAMRAIDADRNVVVAAPTGAGKTLIAHYAIDKALAAGERVIYTAPIKALSNQKYRDLQESHPGQVGISTGDVSIDSGAAVVVMTTEIFRNTIFDDPDRAAQIRWVIFDEIHYLDDPDRGTVWEESLIFAPPGVRILGLSATVSNLEEFADWMEEVRDHPVEVVLETKRPVPLEVNVASTEGKIVPFKRIDRLKLDRAGFRRRFEKRQRDLRGYYERCQEKLVAQIAERDHLPLLFFMFSRKACGRLAESVARHQDLMDTPEQGRAAREAFDQLARAFDLDLRDEDVSRLASMVQRGIAYHHAGVLPALKEVIERLFGAGHLRLLCATETFALGVNMPARSVAFEGVMRWNGKARVPLMTRQYQQMAGRAGRRGLDDRGFVYVTFDPFRDETRTVNHMVEGKVEPVRSQFNLSYGTLLNLHERLGEELYDACERSFANFRAKRAAGAVRGRAASEDDSAEDSGRRGRRGKRGESGRNSKRGRGRDRRGGRRRGGRRGKNEREESKSGRNPKAKRRTNYDGIVQQVKRKMTVLRELGYIGSNEEITPRGRFAMQVFGHEMALSELVFGRALEGLDAEQIAVTMAAIVFESRNSDSYGGPLPQRLIGKTAHRLADKAVSGLVRLEEARGIKVPVKPLDWNLSGAVWAWVGGAELADLKDVCDASDGDIVRALRQTIQLLRLAVAPLKQIGEEALAQQVVAAQRLLKRDQVDAEWQLRRAAELAGLSPEEMEAELAAQAEETAPRHPMASRGWSAKRSTGPEFDGDLEPTTTKPADDDDDDFGPIVDEDDFAHGLLDESEERDEPLADESSESEASDPQDALPEGPVKAKRTTYDPDDFSAGLL